MMLGFEASYTENDPTAGMKMQYAQELIERNPKVKEVAGQDELFSQLIENYMGNLQHSVQQQENSKIGRIGVKNVT
jgi:DNA-binding MurR/RpiR family transcriptional regulator